MTSSSAYLRIATLILGSAVSFGCGDGQTVSGTIDGRAFHGRQAFFGTPMQLLPSTGQFQTSTALSIADFSNSCLDSSSTQWKGGLIGIALYVDRAALDASVHQPQTFSQGDTAGTTGLDFASVNYTLYTAADQTTSNASAATVTVTSVSGEHISGTVDISFEEGHVSGAFEASHCASLDYVH